MVELPYISEDRLQRLGIPMGPRMRILQEAQGEECSVVSLSCSVNFSGVNACKIWRRINKFAFNLQFFQELSCIQWNQAVGKEPRLDLTLFPLVVPCQPTRLILRDRITATILYDALFDVGKKGSGPSLNHDYHGMWQSDCILPPQELNKSNGNLKQHPAGNFELLRSLGQKSHQRACILLARK